MVPLTMRIWQGPRLRCITTDVVRTARPTVFTVLARSRMAKRTAFQVWQTLALLDTPASEPATCPFIFSLPSGRLSDAFITLPNPAFLSFDDPHS